MAACKAVCVRNNLPLLTVPLLVGGDLNSVPNSNVLSYLTTGVLPLPRKLTGFACDDNLYQLTRWLRMLGIDTIVFSLQSLLRGVSESRSKQFATWQKEGRAMITMSRQLVQRRGAPVSHTINNKGRVALELEFQKIVRRFGVEMFTQSKLFFGRCVKCNSLILPIERKNIPPSSIGEGKNVPSFVFDSNEALFMCGEVAAETKTPLKSSSVVVLEEKKSTPNWDFKNYNRKETKPDVQRSGCGQVYWWGKGADGTTTTVNRAISLVDKLQMYVKDAGDLENLIDGNNSIFFDSANEASSKTRTILQFKKEQQQQQGENTQTMLRDVVHHDDVTKIIEQYHVFGENSSRVSLFSTLYSGDDGNGDGDGDGNGNGNGNGNGDERDDGDDDDGDKEIKKGSGKALDTSRSTLSMQTAKLVVDNLDSFDFGYGLRSCYDRSSKHHVTNQTPNFADVLDYIFCNTKGVTIKNTIPVAYSFAKASGITTNNPSIPMLPCESWPSDHLMLISEVEIKN
jgi:uncharacterized protein with PIN domain